MFAEYLSNSKTASGSASAGVAATNGVTDVGSPPIGSSYVAMEDEIIAPTPTAANSDAAWTVVGTPSVLAARLPPLIVADLRAIVIEGRAPSEFQRPYHPNDPFSPQLFNRAQAYVFALMRRDYFARFLRLRH
jgi:hypothetical protein